MSDRSAGIERAVAGAAIGGLVSYLYLTDHGREVRQKAELWVDEFLDAMKRMQGAAAKAQRAIDEGRSSWEAVRQLGRGASGRVESGVS